MQFQSRGNYKQMLVAWTDPRNTDPSKNFRKRKIGTELAPSHTFRLPSGLFVLDEQPGTHRHIAYGGVYSALYNTRLRRNYYDNEIKVWWLYPFLSHAPFLQVFWRVLNGPHGKYK